MGDAARAGDEKVTPLRGRQLTLIAGGATVDSSAIGSVRFAAGTKELDAEFKKGDDVLVTVVARVTDVKLTDTYDAHGNIAETIRAHGLRVDEVRSVGLERAQAAVTAAEAQAAEDAAEAGDDPAPEPAFEPEPEPEPGEDDGEVEPDEGQGGEDDEFGDD